jgi:hypothetical protein
MAQQIIPGTRTLWEVLRDYINDNFTEVYTKLFEAGKVLTDNNYTTTEKNKLAGLTDEVVEYANLAAFPVTGVSGIIYVAIDTGLIYRWTGSVYTEVSNVMTSAQLAALSAVTLPAAATLTTGSNAINLTNIAGQEYNVYDMASGALTLTIAASPVRGGCAYGIIIADGTTAPTVSAFTVLSGEYTNTNDVQNHFFISYKYNGSGVLTGYLQWLQPV